jgi:hypothetical protein
VVWRSVTPIFQQFDFLSSLLMENNRQLVCGFAYICGFSRV